MTTKDSISIRYRATDTVYIAGSSVGRITFICICTVESTPSLCYIFKKYSEEMKRWETYLRTESADNQEG